MISLLWHGQRRGLGRIVCDGDSITEAPSETEAQRYPTIAAAAINNGHCAYVNSGLSGTTLAAMVISFSTDIAQLYDNTRFFNVALCAGGTNDLASGGTASALITQATTWRDAAIAAHFKPAFMTLLPRNVGGGAAQTTFDAARATYNAWVLALTNTIIFDAGNISQLQDYTSSTYYKEPPGGFGVHPTPAGLALMGALLASSVNSWLEAGRP